MKESAPVSFSVVIPNYNHAAYLPECLDSVLSQTLQPEAIYVLDDASTDGSLEVLRAYSRRHSVIRLIESKKNRGVVATINESLPLLQTTHVFFLGADDYLLPGYFEAAHALLSKHPAAGICTAETVTLNLDGTKKAGRLGWSNKPAWLSPQELIRVARGGCTFQCFFQVGGMRRIGGFSAGLRWHCDHFAVWTLAARHGLCYLPNPGAVFRQSVNSYCAQGAKSKEHRQVLLNALEYLHRPDLADVREGLRDAHVLSIFDEGLFSALWGNPRNRYFLTPSFLWMLVRRRIKLVVRHPIPAPVKRWFRSRFASQANRE